MNLRRATSSVNFQNILTQHIAQFSCLKKRTFSELFVGNNLNKNHVELAGVLHQFLGQRRCLSAGMDSVEMAGVESVGMKLTKVVEELETFAPKSMAGSWDNVGLLVEPATPRLIQRILLTIDLTEAVMQEALDLSVDMIISYHPPIFAPLKSVTMRTWKERVVALCLEHRIAVYSPHTSYDAKVGGVNDWLAAAFDTKSTMPLLQSFKRSILTYRADFTFYKCENVTSDSFLQVLRREKVEEGNSLKSIHKGDNDAFTQLTLECTTSQLALVTKTFNDLLPPDMKSSMSVTKVEGEPVPGSGMGRLCRLKKPITVRRAIELVKRHIDVPHVRLALAKNKTIDSEVRHVALCAGSGVTVLRGVGADLWLTGEMLHHDVLDANHNGSHVILCNHSDSERGYLKQLAEQLSLLFKGKISFHISSKDSDPLKTV